MQSLLETIDRYSRQAHRVSLHTPGTSPQHSTTTTLPPIQVAALAGHTSWDPTYIQGNLVHISLLTLPS
jgi:hypothetical protein